MNTERECQWTASPDGAWIKVTDGSSGQGPGTVQVAATANGDPVTRTAAVVVNNQRVQVSQAAAECRLDLSSNATSMSSAGGSGSVEVRASSPLCTWTAASDASWIAITSGANGKGSAAVTFTVSPSAGLPRSGTLKIAGQSFTVDQSEGCSFSITPAAYAAASGGGSTSVSVTTAPACPWTAASNASWITVGTGGGAGSGVVGITVAPTTGAPRTGTAIIAGQTFTVTQSEGCTFAVAPGSASAAASGGTGRFDVAAGVACTWTSRSDASWLTVTAGSAGTGNGAVQYTVAPNTGASRTGTIRVADAAFVVTQAGSCSVSIAPASQTVANGGATLSVAVTAAAGCPWTATSNATWIGVAAGNNGSGSGTVQLSIAANTGADRSGTVTIGAQTFTVTQTGGCAYTLSASSQQVPSGGGSGSFAVTTAAGCSWTASASDAWLSVTSGSSGSGSGAVQFTAAANSGAARSGTIAVAGQTFIVNQDGGCAATVSPASFTAAAGGDTQAVQVTTAATCSWTSTSGAPWISFTGSSSGNGNGAVQLAIAPNTGPARTGTATIASRTVAVSQENGCSYTIAPSSRELNDKGGKVNVSVSTGDGCSWEAKSEVSWIQVMRGATGTGDGTVQLDVDRNNGDSRTGTVIIAGKTFTIRQQH